MALPLPIPRLHLFEIDDQSWFPQPLREYIQASLTLFWTLHVPLIQPMSPASLVAQTLQKALGPEITTYTFVDFCSGAGGPTLHIEQEVNRRLSSSARPYPSPKKKASSATTATDGRVGPRTPENEPPPTVPFILTDLHPHLPAWTHATTLSKNIHYIPQPIDATSPPPSLLSLAVPPLPKPHSHPHSKSPSPPPQKPFHLYSLAFHHLPPTPAQKTLRHTLSTASGFAILELQGRDLGSVITVLLLAPLLWLGSWYWFWGHWGHLFFTYVVPVVPVVVAFDGVVSCLRTRRGGEVRAMIEGAFGEDGGKKGGWRFEGGREVHTWPGGGMEWFVGVRVG